ncbi:MAG: nitroreductase family protein [Spirochaetota bacterium]|nr:MAG: nitroreductase family protein [Spirochaetota bacterium]
MKIFPVKIEAKCLGCEKCKAVCPRHISQIDPDEHLSECISCFQCYAVCPNNAITFSKKELEETGPLPAIDKDDLKSFLAFRRSNRLFSTKPVKRETIVELIHSAQHIPSGGNAHNCKFTIITDQEVKNRLLQLIKKRYVLQFKFLQVPIMRFILTLFTDPVTRAFLNDREYLKRIIPLVEGMKNGKDLVFYNAPVVIAVHSDQLIPTPGPDSILAAYNIVLMAHAMGMGTCFVSMVQNAVNNSNKCRALLKLGRRERVHAVILLGHNKLKYQRPIPMFREDHYRFIKISDIEKRMFPCST